MGYGCGTAEGFAAGLQLVEPRGTIVLKSTYAELPSADLTRAVIDEVRIVGSRCGPFPAALRALSAQLIDVEPLIDARYPLEEGLRALQHAAQDAADGRLDLPEAFDDLREEIPTAKRIGVLVGGHGGLGVQRGAVADQHQRGIG